MTKLKDCPFCGGSNIEEDWSSLLETSEGCIQTGFIECKDCGAMVDYEVNESNMDFTTGGARLYEKWNRRKCETLSEEDKQLIEANKELCEMLAKWYKADFTDPMLGITELKSATWDVILKHNN